ncbi:MAG: hypothetical protein K0Q55_3970, partial [Verrucomicrobia bacterium]|nr:hypothetical protein [Verrucomicrobiota bacterium]
MGEVIGNLTVGVLMGVLAIPLTLIHLALLWVVIRIVRGGNPISEILGRGSMARDNSFTAAVVLFAVFFAAYLWWDKSREERNKKAGKKDNDPSAMDIGLIVLQILFAAPAVVMTAFGFFRNILAWGSLDVAHCAAVLTRLLGSPHRVALETLQRELPNVDLEG